MPGLFIEKHTQSFTSKFNTDINTLRGNKCERLNRTQPFTFLSFLKFTHSVASLTHPSSTHPSLSLQEVRKVISVISSIATPSLATLPSVVQKALPGQMGYTLLSLQQVWMHCKKPSSACPEVLEHEYPDGILFRCPK